jgi:hypothetical protein
VEIRVDRLNQNEMRGDMANRLRSSSSLAHIPLELVSRRESTSPYGRVNPGVAGETARKVAPGGYGLLHCTRLPMWPVCRAAQ